MPAPLSASPGVQPGVTLVTFGKMGTEVDLRIVADEHSPADLRGGELPANSTSKSKIFAFA